MSTIKRSYLPPPPSMLTGPLQQYLTQVHRVFNQLPVMSVFSGVNPNTSNVTGIPGDLTVNVGSLNTTNRLWILGGADQSRLTTQGWVAPSGGGGGGTVGPQGIQGPAGPAGPAGATGATGPSGATGPAGSGGSGGGYSPQLGYARF